MTAELPDGGADVRWVDNHCHLPDDADAASMLIDEAADVGVVHLIDVGTDLERSRSAITRAERHTQISATVGMHPHDASGDIVGIEELSHHAEVVAIGEWS